MRVEERTALDIRVGQNGSQVRDLGFHPNGLEALRANETRGDGELKVTLEIGETESIKTIKRNSESKSWFF